jgi:hypothetical protein
MWAVTRAGTQSSGLDSCPAIMASSAALCREIAFDSSSSCWNDADARAGRLLVT